MKIPWKLKSFIFSVIDFFDAPNFLYFLQRNVTKRSRVKTMEIDKIWVSHKNFLSQYKSCGRVFEFGAGKTLGQNLYLSGLINEQLVVDLNPMIELSLVNHWREHLSQLVEMKSDIKIENLMDLEKYGITYKAPYDAAKTSLDDKSLDACISTNTLEHIPEASIVSIFSELGRTLKDDGIVSARIDYSDHYAQTDPSISLLNFLSFDDETWEHYNHHCHYQNRLRHYEYLRIFKDAGFVVVQEELEFGEPNIPIGLIEKFKDSNATWKATAAHILLKKAR